MSASDFKLKLRSEFPEVEHREFKLCRAGRSKLLVTLPDHVDRPEALRKFEQHQRSCLYLLPIAVIKIRLFAF